MAKNIYLLCWFIGRIRSNLDKVFTLPLASLTLNN